MRYIIIFLLVFITMSQLESLPLKPLINRTLESKILFENNPNSDLYWHALIHLSKNNKDAALELIRHAQKEDHHFVSLDFNPDDSIELCFDKLFIHCIANDPQTLSFLGLFESIGIRDHNAYLNDLTLQAITHEIETKKKCLNALKQYENESLTSEQYLSYKIVKWMFERAVETEKFLFHEYRLNQMFSVLSDLANTFTRFHQLELSEDIEVYLVRLQKIPQQINETIALLQHQKSCGIVTPTFALEKVISSIKKTIPEPVTECFLYTHLVDASKTIKECEYDALMMRAQTIMATQVYPAYKILLAFCQELIDDSKNVYGVWALPNGDAFYAHCLARHTTTHLTADEIHELGLSEVAKIQQAMRDILAKEDFVDASKTVGQLMQEVSKDPRFYFPATPEGRAQCLSAYETILERCKNELYPLFDIKPKISVKIEPVPAHEEESQPAAYYIPPSIDGKRPGTFYANLRNLDELPCFGMETLTIHEAEPGHHFQIALQQEMDISILRKMGEFTAYVEGWALYAEKLAFEQNFYSSSFAELGHLQDELLRAVRLVVDTGIHKKRWSREQAIAYMQQNTGYHLNSIITEVERYFVMPGQACAYKIGQLKILELRQRAKDALKEKFDIKEFHNVVLMVGACPLTVLEEVVDTYIAKQSMQ
jgi:uncharacterized protein (DUF885 family)